jgi:hypothetical protein
MRRILPLAPLAFFVACGSGPSNQAAPDAGPTADAMTVDARAADAGRDASSPDAGDDSVDASEAGILPEGAVLPSGTQVVASDMVTLDGITSDGFAVYTDTSTNTIYAVATAGGVPSTVGSLPAASTTMRPYVQVAGPVVAFGGSSPDTGRGPLSIWTSAAGVHPISTQAGPFGFVTSASGAAVAYLDDVNFSGIASCDIAVVQADGTGRTTLLSGVDIEAPVSIEFAGETAVVAATLLQPASPGAGVPLQTFVPPSWTSSTLAPAVLQSGAFMVNPAGTALLAQTSAGLSVLSLDGSANLLDAAGVSGLFTSDGTSVVYVTGGGALSRVDLGSMAKTPLVPSEFPALLALSPDGTWATGTVTAPPSNEATQQISADLYLASAASPGTAQTVSTTANTAVVPAFTVDSSHALFVTDTSSGGLSNLQVHGVGDGTTRTFPGVWTFFQAEAGRVVFNDDYRPTGGVGSSGTADIEWLDTTQAAPPKVLVSQADANFFVTPDGATLVYSWSYASGHPAGIWTLPLP